MFYSMGLKFTQFYKSRLVTHGYKSQGVHMVTLCPDIVENGILLVLAQIQSSQYCGQLISPYRTQFTQSTTHKLETVLESTHIIYI